MILFHPKVLATVLALSAITVAATTTLAHEYEAGRLSIRHPWARETAAGQVAGGGFMTVVNNGNREDRLVSASSPVADEVQLHTMSMDGGVMRMRRDMEGFAIPAHGSLELRPGSNHVMFMGLKHALRPGEQVPVTLRFQRAGTVRVRFAVQAVGAMAPMDGSHAGH